MSPASKSKSKGKKANKGSSKTSGHANSTDVTPASGYNPISGTFHTFDAAPVPSANQVIPNGRFRNIDDMDDSNEIIVDYDSVSNAESWSGGSEDHREKPSQLPPCSESVPRADNNDKREKMRQKNERKHQRQKEKRAQELHERCCGYLMSRKMEYLAQQLVAMGFSQEQATMALILNEGRVEESVAWLFDAGEEQIECNYSDGGGNLKIDISEELSRITEMVVRYKATKQEVERAVVSCEGDLEKAEENLKAQKEEPITVPKPEEIGDPPTLTNGKSQVTINQNPLRVQEKPNPTIIQQKRDEKDFNYTKSQAIVGSSVDIGTKSMQVLKKIQPPKPEWPKPHQLAAAVEKRWPNAGSSQSVAFSSASPLQVSVPSSKQESRYTPITNELKSLELGSGKEPAFVMQRPESINMSKQAPTTSLSSYPKPNGFIQPLAVSRSISPNTVNPSNAIYNQIPYHQSQQQFIQPGVSNSIDSQGTIPVNSGGLLNRGGTSPPLTPATSLGLFSGIRTAGLNGCPPQVDWSTGSKMQFDYTDIDWSLNPEPLISKASPLWSNSSYNMSQNNVRAYDSFGYGGMKSNVIRPVATNGSVGSVRGLRDGVLVSGDQGGNGSSREWTSPFEEKDLFSIPRQFIYSPSL